MPDSMRKTYVLEAPTTGHGNDDKMAENACVVSKLCVGGKSLVQYSTSSIRYAIAQPFAWCSGRVTSVILGVKADNV